MTKIAMLGSAISTPIRSSLKASVETLLEQTQRQMNAPPLVDSGASALTSGVVVLEP